MVNVCPATARSGSTWNKTTISSPKRRSSDPVKPGRVPRPPKRVPKWQDDWHWQLLTPGILDYTREYPFAARWGRRWKFDYAWPAQRIAVELEGGLWRPGGGAHSHPSGVERDIDKYNRAQLLGWLVLRITDKHVRSGEALTLLQEALALR